MRVRVRVRLRGRVRVRVRVRVGVGVRVGVRVRVTDVRGLEQRLFLHRTEERDGHLSRVRVRARVKVGVRARVGVRVRVRVRVRAAEPHDLLPPRPRRTREFGVMDRLMSSPGDT